MTAQTEEAHLLELAARIVRETTGRRLRADQVEVGEERVQFRWHGKVVGSLARSHWDLLKVEAEQGLEAARTRATAQAANKPAPRAARASKDPSRCPSCCGKAYARRPVALGRLCGDLFHAPAPKEGADA